MSMRHQEPIFDAILGWKLSPLWSAQENRSLCHVHAIHWASNTPEFRLLMMIHVELLVGCPPGIMNVILAAEHSPCDEFDDYGDHLDWRFCAFRALDNGCILVVTQSKWRWWVAKMVDSNEVHQWRWIIWGVWVHLCILVYTINHSSRSCWASADSSRWILVNPGQAKPCSSSKAMLQPSPTNSIFAGSKHTFAQKANSIDPTSAGRENHGMFDSSFGDSIDLHLSCDPDRCFRLGMSGQVECCGNLCQGLEDLEGLAGTPQTWHQVTKPPLRWRFEITSFLSLSRGGGRQNCRFWWFPPDAIERICSTMMIEPLSLLFISLVYRNQWYTLFEGISQSPAFQLVPVKGKFI